MFVLNVQCDRDIGHKGPHESSHVFDTEDGQKVYDLTWQTINAMTGEVA
jgi:hypothetical protein